MILGRVSVIIPNYNYGRYIADAVNSVLNQTYTNIECIVINNGSSDNSLETLGLFKDRIVVIDQINLGQSGARNVGLDRAEGEFVAFLDADDYWEPTKLEDQLNLISKTSQLVYCGIRQFDDITDKTICILSPEFKGNCANAHVDYPSVSVVLSGESTALFTKELVTRVGYFDTQLNSSAGWDFFRRASRFTEFNYIDSPLVNYRIHKNNMSNSSINNVQDIKMAYSKLLEDKDWAINPLKAKSLLRNLEITFFKTYFKEGKIGHALKSIFKLIRNDFTHLSL